MDLQGVETMTTVEDVTRKAAGHDDSPVDRVANYPLVKALIERRTRRFAKGSTLNGGPLKYQSAARPAPLSLKEEATLAFAACGITGRITGDMPYQTGDTHEAGTGYVLTNFAGRTVGSADSVHSVAMCVINDDGAWLLKRPQDYPRSDIPGLAAAGREHRFVELYEKSRVRFADHRLDVPHDTQVVMPFNKWAANAPGTTYYIPVAEMTSLYINVMLMLFDEDLACCVIDDRNGFRPAGIGKFTRSKGGYLHDDPRTGRYLLPMSYVESVLAELTAVEQGMMLQNLALTTEALGLGGFTHFAAHPFLWLQALGFRMQVLPFTRTVGASRFMRLAAKVFNKEQPFPTALGLERNGEMLLKPFCPPYYRSMEEAVHAFLDQKYASGTGAYRDGGGASMWKDGAAVQAGIGRYSQRAVDATVAYCDYVYRRYGRFPAAYGAFHTVLAFQAHHLDNAFYDRFYRPEILTSLHREHQ
jgi:hypothetical protein